MLRAKHRTLPTPSNCARKYAAWTIPWNWPCTLELFTPFPRTAELFCNWPRDGLNDWDGGENWTLFCSLSWFTVIVVAPVHINTTATDRILSISRADPMSHSLEL